MASKARRDAAWEYRQQKRREGLSPGEADRAALEQYPDVTWDELNPGHGRNWWETAGDFVSDLFGGGPDLPRPDPSGFVEPSRSSMAPVPFSAYRMTQPGGPFNPMGGLPGPTLPGTMPGGLSVAAPRGFGSVIREQLTFQTTPTQGEATNTTPQPRRGISALEWALLINEALGTVADLYGAYQAGKIAEEERKERKRARSTLLPYYLKLLERT